MNEIDLTAKKHEITYSYKHENDCGGYAYNMINCSCGYTKYLGQCMNQDTKQKEVQNHKNQVIEALLGLDFTVK